LNIPFIILFFYFKFFAYQQTPPFYISPIDLFFVWQQTQLLDSKTVLHALRVNFGHTTMNTIFRLVKLLADLSTMLKLLNVSHKMRATFNKLN